MPLSLIKTMKGLRGADLDVVHETKLVKLYEIRDGRNAWWSTWVTRYYAENFHLNLVDAKDTVERMRVQGSQWTIVECPACMFIGGEMTIAVMEVNTKKPLANSAYTGKCKPFIAEIVRAFKPIQPNTILRFAVTGGNAIQAVGGFRAWNSRSSGGGYPLGWSKVSKDWDLDGIEHVCSVYSESLLNHAFLGISMEFSDDHITIVRIHPRGPLGEDGVVAGDRIVGAERNGQSCFPVRKAIEALRPGDRLRLTIRRGSNDDVFEHQAKSFRDVLTSWKQSGERGAPG